MLRLLHDVLVPVCVTITYQNSFLVQWSVAAARKLKAPWFEEFLACPFCLGFHVGWVVTLLTYGLVLRYAVEIAFITSVGSGIVSLVLSALRSLDEFLELSSNRK